jgi:hypothetical protein
MDVWYRQGPTSGETMNYGRTTWIAPLMALLLTACAVPGAPPHASIYPKGHHELANDPGFALEVDFEQHTNGVDIHGERYAGDLVGVPGYNALESQLRALSGARMECILNQHLPNVWEGQCTDSQGQVYVLNVGHHWSV